MPLHDHACEPATVPPRRSTPWLVTLLSWAFLAATLAGFGGGLSWVLGLFSPMRFQLLMCSGLLLLIILLGVRRWRWPAHGALAAALMSVLVNALLVAPLWLSTAVPSGHAPGPNQPTITILAANLFVGNSLLDDVATAGPVARVIDSSGAAIVLVQEITVHRLGVLAAALPQYRLVAGTGKPNAFGIALFIRKDAPVTIESAKEIDLTAGMTTVKQIELRCQWQGRPLSLLGMHTISAIHAKHDRYRAALLEAAAGWSIEQLREERAAIICGDFNATPWCAPFVDMLAQTKLVNSQRGFGLQGSWPARAPAPLRIPIDHCLHSEDLITLDRRITPAIPGSDHLPLTVQLQWKRTLPAATQRVADAHSLKEG